MGFTSRNLTELYQTAASSHPTHAHPRRIIPSSGFPRTRCYNSVTGSTSTTHPRGSASSSRIDAGSLPLITTFQRQRPRMRGTKAGAGPRMSRFATPRSAVSSAAAAPSAPPAPASTRACVGVRQAHEPAERRVAQATTKLDLVAVEGVVVVRCRRLDRVVVGRVRLDDHAAALWARVRRGPPPAPAAGTCAPRTRKSGRCSAMSAEMTPTSVTSGMSSPLAIICVPMRMSDSCARNRARIASWASLPLRDVAVPAQRPAPRERLLRLLLHALGADPHSRMRVAFADRTLLRRRRAPLAVVADKHALPLVVVSARRRTTALRHVAAVPALHERRGAAAVQEEHHLLLRLQRFATWPARVTG